MSESVASCTPVVTPAEISIPACPAIVNAVCGWSPVIITTRIPARWHSEIAGGTSVRMGSARPINPTKLRFRELWSGANDNLSPRIAAMPRTRKPFVAIVLTAAMTRSRSSASALQRLRTASGAPLQAASCPESCCQMFVIAGSAGLIANIFVMLP